MNKLSDYLPLLIILGSLIFTAIGKMRKPDKVTQKTTLPGNIPVETVKEIVDRKKSSQTFGDSYQKKVEEKPQKQVFQRQEIKQGKEIVSFSSTPIALESEEEENSPFTFEEDDLVKAIIYTEIINKKEY